MIAVVVPAAAAGQRLDRFLATLTVMPTRSQAKALIDAGAVRVDGVVRKASFALAEGAHVEFALSAPAPTTVVAEPLPLTVLYEDAEFLAIDKPPGMAAHPAPGTRGGTVVNALLHRLGGLPGVGDPQRPGIVHRLDKDTSGVMLIARTVTALGVLGKQFQARSVHKRYLALVHGRVRGDAGRIDQPIGRHPTDRKKMSVHTQKGRAAVTDWRVVERLPDATLVELRPETGRTHQIRVHLLALGYPVVGDAVYGARRSRRGGRAQALLAAFPRQALHAAEIRFQHPTTGAPLVLSAPLPTDFATLLDDLRQARVLEEESAKNS